MGHTGLVYAVAFSPDGSTLASTSADGTTRLWDPATGRRLASFDNPPGQMAGRIAENSISIALSFAPDGKTLIAAGTNGMLATWDWKSRKETQRKVLKKTGSVRPVFLPDLQAVLTASGGEWDFEERATEAMHLWKLGTGSAISDMPLRGKREIYYNISCTGIAASPDERILVSSQVHTSQSLRGPVYHDPSINFWERVTGKEIMRIDKCMTSAMAFSPDSRILAANDGGASGFHGRVGSPSMGATIGLWDTLSAERQATFAGHTGAVRCIVFSPDGKTIASASADHTILIWKTPERKDAIAKDEKVPAAQLQRLWADLAGESVNAHKAAVSLIANRTQAVALIRENVPPAVAADQELIKSLIKDLNSTQFTVRDRAVRSLEELQDLAEPALRAALPNSPSLETRRRLEYLLEAAAINTGKQVQNLRALTILERIATPEARAVLESLGKGPMDARLTREAQASLGRLSRK